MHGQVGFVWRLMTYRIFIKMMNNRCFTAWACGSGVSFSVQAGKRLAEKVAEQQVPNLPLYNKALPKFPFAPLRRVGQWGYFHYGKVKDQWF